MLRDVGADIISKACSPIQQKPKYKNLSFSKLGYEGSYRNGAYWKIKLLWFLNSRQQLRLDWNTSFCHCQVSAAQIYHLCQRLNDWDWNGQ